LLISPLEGVGAVGLKDVTPVATLVDEQIIFAVAADSPFKTGRAGRAFQVLKCPGHF